MPVVVVVVVSFLTCLLESKSVLQESTLAVCKGFIFHPGWGCAQAAAAQGPGGSCSAECSYTGQVLLPESHFLPSHIAPITARLTLGTGFLN